MRGEQSPPGTPYTGCLQSQMRVRLKLQNLFLAAWKGVAPFRLSDLLLNIWLRLTENLHARPVCRDTNTTQWRYLNLVLSAFSRLNPGWLKWKKVHLHHHHQEDLSFHYFCLCMCYLLFCYSFILTCFSYGVWDTQLMSAAHIWWHTSTDNLPWLACRHHQSVPLCAV